MFVAKVAGRMLCTVSGIKIPLSRRWGKSLGLQYLDCETAIERCEAHFAEWIEEITHFEEVTNKAEMDGARLLWSGMQASSSIPFSLVKMTDADGIPDIVTFDIRYTIHELQLWDIRMR